MDKPKCSVCEYARIYTCRHPRIRESAKKYEERTGKYIVKSCDFIGWKIPKTSLRWCPLKMEKNNEREIR